MIKLIDGKILVNTGYIFNAIDSNNNIHFTLEGTSHFDQVFQLENGNIIMFGSRETIFPIYAENGKLIGKIELNVFIDVGVTKLSNDRFISRDDGKVFDIDGIIGRLNEGTYNYLGLKNGGIVALHEDKIVIYDKYLKKIREFTTSLISTSTNIAIQYDEDTIICASDKYLNVWSLTKGLTKYIDITPPRYMIPIRNGKVFLQCEDRQIVYNVKQNSFVKELDVFSFEAIELLDGNIAILGEDIIIKDDKLNTLEIIKAEFPSHIGQFDNGKMIAYWNVIDNVNGKTIVFEL